MSDSKRQGDMGQFFTRDVDGVHVIKCPREIDQKSARALDSLIQTWAPLKCKVHLLDFKETETFDPVSYRPFVVFNQLLKNEGKSMFSINMSNRIANEVKSGGLATIFNIVANIDEMKMKLQGPKVERPLVDVELINPFILSARKIFEVQAKTSLVPMQPYVRKPELMFKPDVVGSMDLDGSTFKGSLLLCFSKEVLAHIYTQMTGETEAQAGNTYRESLRDCVGELLNMIYGDAKTQLNEKKNLSLKPVLPRVLTAEQTADLMHDVRPFIVIPFASSFGEFQILIYSWPTKSSLT